MHGGSYMLAKQTYVRSDEASYWNTLNEEKLKTVFTADETKTVEEASKEGVQWLESNPDADADAIECKQKQLEAKFNLIMM